MNHSNVAYCLDCRALVAYTSDRKFVDHQGGGLRPNGKHCDASLQPLPIINTPEWDEDEDEDE